MVEQAPIGESPPPALAGDSGAHARQPASGRSGRLRLQRSALTRRCMGALGALVVTVGLLILAVGALVLRLSHGPISIDRWAPQIAAEISERFGGGYDFALGSASIENGAHGATLSIDGFTLRNSSGRAILMAPRAEISVAVLPLLKGSVQPTRLELLDVDMRLTLMPDGAVALSLGNEPIVLSPSMSPSMSPSVSVPDRPALEVAGRGHATVMQSLAGALHAIAEYALQPESAIGSLERLSVARGKLVFERAATQDITTFDGVELAFDKHAGAAMISISANGPRGRWQARAQATGMPGGARSLEVDLTDLSFDEIALATGLQDAALSFDMPVSTKMRFALDAQGAITGANGGFAIGAGKLVMAANADATISIDEAIGKLRWNPELRRVEIEAAQFNFRQTQIAFTGALTPPQSPAAPWLLQMNAAAGGVIGPAKAGDPTIVLDRLAFAARVFPLESRLHLDGFEAAGPQVNLKGDTEIAWETGARRLKIGLAVGKMPSAAVLRLWPGFVAPAVREYLVDRLRSGTLERASVAIDFDEAALGAMGTDIPLGDDRMRIDYTVSNAALAFLPGVPPVTGIEATGRVTGRTANVNVSRGALEAGGGRRLAISEAGFAMADTNRKPAPAQFVARVIGPLDAVSDILAREGLKVYGGTYIDSSVMKGQVDGKLTIDMKLAKAIRAGDTAVRVAAAINNFSIEKIIGKEKFDQGVLNVTVDSAGTKASGQGRLLGGPATIELKKQASGATDATVQFTIDEAARNRLGMHFVAGLTGPVGARVTKPFGKEDAPAQVELDLTRAAIDGLLPGFVKLAGRPAKASFVLDTSEGSTSIENLVFDAPGSGAARGSVELDANGGFRSAKLSHLRLSPGDDMKLDADQTKEGLKLVVRGNAVDARPFLRGLMRADALPGPAAAGPRDAGAPRDMEIDLKTALVTGYNRQTLSNVELRVTRRGGAIRTFQLQARSGKSSIAGGTQRGAEGAGPISLTSTDGGALLSFLDLYKRMEGGKMLLNAKMSGGGLEGGIHVTDFVLRDEPALRRLVTEGAQARGDRPGQARIETSAAEFRRLSATFTRGGGRFVVRDGVLLGQQIGLKLDGVLDTANDRVNMTGVFIPAYGLNNLFSQVPLFGPILGGDRNEGLFAVNFRIAGPASAPVMTINPLSAIAPGFLRKIFGAIDGTGTPAAPAAAAEAEAVSPSRSMPMSIQPGRN